SACSWCATTLFLFKQKTAYEVFSYWSSDVCSSDLHPADRDGLERARGQRAGRRRQGGSERRAHRGPGPDRCRRGIGCDPVLRRRSEERRVGEEDGGGGARGRGGEGRRDEDALRDAQ